MRVDEFATLAASQMRDGAGRTKIEFVTHPRFEERRIGIAASERKLIGLDGRENRLVAELGKHGREQILDAFGSGVMLAVDHMQHATQRAALAKRRRVFDVIGTID